MKSLLASPSLLRTSLLAAALSGVLASTASAQLIVNGGFEAQPFNTTVTATTTPNAGGITGWTVATTSSTTEFQIVNGTSGGGFGFPAPVAGSFYLSINGGESSVTGRLYQDFTTTIGATYSVAFSAGLAGATGSQQIGLQADVYNVVSGSTSGGSLGTTSATTTSGTAGFFSPSAFSFTATGVTSRLMFADISAGTNGVDVVLDNVSVSAIPEPSTYAAIAGAAMLGLAVWQRRKPTAAPATVA